MNAMPCLVQEEWDEEKEPDGFLMTGAVPLAKADGAAATTGAFILVI